MKRNKGLYLFLSLLLALALLCGCQSDASAQRLTFGGTQPGQISQETDQVLVQPGKTAIRILYCGWSPSDSIELLLVDRVNGTTYGEALSSGRITEHTLSLKDIPAGEYDICIRNTGEHPIENGILDFLIVE